MLYKKGYVVPVTFCNVQNQFGSPASTHEKFGIITLENLFKIDCKPRQEKFPQAFIDYPRACTDLDDLLCKPHKLKRKKRRPAQCW